MPVHRKAATAVLASILVFGLGLSRFGLVSATAASVMVATLPAPRAGLGLARCPRAGGHGADGSRLQLRAADDPAALAARAVTTWEGLLYGLGFALQPGVLVYCLLGVVLGTFVGVLPGIGAMAAISLLLPVTYYISAEAALIMLAGVYYGAQYGGAVASILMRLPGTPQSAVTALDGYPMARQGRAGVALFAAMASSFAGSVIGIVGAGDAGGVASRAPLPRSARRIMRR